MSTYRRVVGVIAGIAGAAFLGYCIYFDKKRRADPQFKQKLKERRLQSKNGAKNKSNLPDMKDKEAVQKFFLEQVQKGEECLVENNIDSCVKHLTDAISVCGEPQQLLGLFKTTLPPHVFQLLVENVTKTFLTEAQLQQMRAAVSAGAAGAAAGAGAPLDDTDVLD